MSSADATAGTLDDGTTKNAKRLLWAGFLAILAAGIGFGVSGGILADWAADFGFTGAQLGAIGGAGFHRFLFRHHHWWLSWWTRSVTANSSSPRSHFTSCRRSSLLLLRRDRPKKTAYMFLYLGNVCFCVGQRHSRSGCQSAGFYSCSPTIEPTTSTSFMPRGRQALFSVV